MNEIVAIICEYNPFHSGHKIQVDAIRKKYPSSKIVAIMSGNCTQRAEFAIMDKYSRAESAVLCGVDAVFEIPYPYSSSNAEIFAKAGVYIASQIGANYLCFGSENNDIEYLKDIAEVIDSKEYNEILSAILNDKSISYPKAREKALLKMGRIVPSAPNDILGVEYIRAINKINQGIQPISIKREGQGYKEYEISDIMSAGAIRKFFYEKNKFVSVPKDSLNVYMREVQNGKILNEKSVKDFLHKAVLLSSTKKFEGIYDVTPGMEYFIITTAENSKNGEEFFEKLTSKSYTYARLRRVVLYMVFGIYEIDSMPKYTVLLASNQIGRAIMKNIKKSAEIEILTKVGAYDKMNAAAINEFEKAIELDKLFFTFLKNPSTPTSAYKYSPFIQK